MARKLDPEEESRFFQAIAESMQTPDEDTALSPSCLRRKENTPLPFSPELAEWFIKNPANGFPS